MYALAQSESEFVLLYLPFCSIWDSMDWMMPNCPGERGLITQSADSDATLIQRHLYRYIQK